MVTLSSPLAWASGHSLDSPLMLVAIFWKMSPAIAAWLVGVGTLFGRSGGLKFLFGVVSLIFGTLFGVLLFEGSPWQVVTAVFGVLAIGIHVVRFGIHLLSRATGGRNKEALRKLWRYL